MSAKNKKAKIRAKQKKNAQAEKKIKAETKRIEEEALALAEKEKKGKVEKGKELIKGGITNIGGSLKSGLKIGFSEAFQLEEFKRQMDAATGSSELAGSRMAAAVKFANDTPFETSSIVDASVKLEKMKMNSEAWMPSIADMAASTSSDIGSAYEAVADASSGNFEKMAEFGIEKGELMAKAGSIHGKNTVFDADGNVKDQIKLQELLMSEMNNKYAGGADALENTTLGMWNSMQGMAKNSLMGIVGMQEDGTRRQGSLLEKLQEKLAMVKELLEKWQEDGTIQSIGEKIADMGAKVMNIFDVIFKFIVKHQETIIKLVAVFLTIAAIINILMTIASVIESITLIMGVFNAIASLNPLTWIVLGIIAAVIALIAIFYMLWKHWDEITAAMAAAFEGLKGVFYSVIDSLRNTFCGFINNIIEGINKVIRLAKKIGIDIPEVPLIEMKTNSEDSRLQTIRSDMTDLPIRGTSPLQKSIMPAELGNYEYNNRPKEIIGAGATNVKQGQNIQLPSQAISSSSKKEIKVEVIIQGNVYGEKDLLDKIGNGISKKLVLALDNMSGVDQLNIVLSANNKEEVKVLPAVPSNINIEENFKNEIFETVNGGEIILIGSVGLRSLNIDSIFPNRKYSWMKKGSSEDGFSYVNFIKKWKEKKMPIRVVITSKDEREILNMAAAIESFSYAIDSVGDISYSLELIEYRFINVR